MIENDGVRFSRQFRGANFALVAEHFDSFKDFFALTKEEEDAWLSFERVIAWTRVWKAGDGTSAFTDEAKELFGSACQEFWEKFFSLYGSKVR
jgi:hypothetical protein